MTTTEWFVAIDAREVEGHKIILVFGQGGRAKETDAEHPERVLEHRHSSGRGLVGWRLKSVADKHLERLTHIRRGGNPRLISLLVDT